MMVWAMKEYTAILEKSLGILQYFGIAEYLNLTSSQLVGKIWAAKETKFMGYNVY